MNTHGNQNLIKGRINRKMNQVVCKKIEEPAERCAVVVSGMIARPLHKSDEQQHMVLVTLPIISV
jgi:hypothetical protein